MSRRHVKDYNYRGHLVDLWYDKREEEYVVTSTLREFNDVSAPSGDQQWAVRCAKRYIDGWKDAGGN